MARLAYDSALGGSCPRCRKTLSKCRCAEQIAANPPLAVQALKRGLREALDPDWDELGRWVSSTLTELFRTDDHREGVQAFLEKRPANFTGR